MRILGYPKDLFMLPFDHRGSFQEKLFGIKGRSPSQEETRLISSYKRIIFDGFQAAVKGGAPTENAAMLVDEQFGADIIQEALSRGLAVAIPVERSSQDEFDFEYGKKFEDHIREFNPTFVKVLVRYNPEADFAINARQLERLRTLSDYCDRENRKFIFELLVPATNAQLQKAGSSANYDRVLRPRLMIQAMAEIQSAEIEPDIWKLEGIESPDDCYAVSEQARTGSQRGGVGVIVLGRGENTDKVRSWISVAANVQGLIGFAVGRTVFWEPLKSFRDQRISREKAVQMIAGNYRGFCDLWMEARLRKAG